MSGTASPSRKPGSFLSLCVLLLAFGISIPGLFRLEWQPQQDKERSPTWILFAELKETSSVGSFDSLSYLDQLLRLEYGDQSIISPLHGIPFDDALRSTPQPSLIDIQQAEAKTPLIGEIELTHANENVFRIIVNARPGAQKIEFPNALRENFEQLSWVERIPDQNVWVPKAKREQALIIPAVLIGFLLALRLALGSWIAAIGAVISSAITVVCVFGFMGWTGVPLNLLILAIPVSVLAIGTSEDVHLISFSKNNHDHRENALQVHRMAIGCTAFTSAMGFAALTAGGHGDIQKFAIIGALSVGLRYIVLHSLFPYICRALPSNDTKKHSGFSKWLGDTIWKQNLALSSHYRLLFASGILCLILSVILSIVIQPSIIPKPLLRSSSQEMVNHEKHKNIFGSQFITKIAVGGLAEESSIQHKLTAIDTVTDELAPLIADMKIVSEPDFWRAAIRKIDPTPLRPWFEYSDSYLEQVALFLSIPKIFQNTDQSNEISFYIIAQDRSFTAQKIDLIQSLEVRYIKNTLTLETDDILNKTLAQSTQFNHTLLYSTLITSTIICILIGLIYLSSIAAATTLFCNLLPAASVGIGICAVGVPISPVTSLFISLSLGVAVNDTLFLLSTYHRFIRSTPDRETAVRETLRSAAFPILISTSTLSLAFLTLSLSEFREINYLGLIVTLVLLSAMFCDLWVTPVLFLKVRIIPIWEQISKEYLEVINGHAPLFKNMPARYIRRFIYFGKIQKAEANTILFQEDDPGETCILILSGTCVVSKKSIVGSVFVSRLHPGDIAGELALEKGSKRSATITTDSAVDYMEFNWEQLDSFRHQYPRAASSVFFNLSQIISQRLRGTLHDLAASAHPFSEKSKI